MSNAELITADMNALALLNKSEIDSQIATAKAYPRDEYACLKRAEKLALMTPDVAAEMFYVLKRGNNRIEGPSIRLAEVVASTWQNIRTGSRVVEVGEKMLTAQGICHDLESNVCMTANVERRITDRNGRRYNDDMIQTASAAAQAIALRNAIFKVIPRGLLNPIYERAKKVAVGDITTIQDRWNKAVTYWSRHNITEEQILEYLEVHDPATVNDEHLATLLGLVNAVKEGQTSLEEAFGIKVQTKEQAKKASKSPAADRLDQGKSPAMPTVPDHLTTAVAELLKCDTEDKAKEAIDLLAGEPDDFAALDSVRKWMQDTGKLPKGQGKQGSLMDTQSHYE